MLRADTSLQFLKGVGPNRAQVFEGLGVIGKALATKIFFGQIVILYHRPHRAIEDEDALGEFVDRLTPFSFQGMCHLQVVDSSRTGVNDDLLDVALRRAEERIAMRQKMQDEVRKLLDLESGLLLLSAMPAAGLRSTRIITTAIGMRMKASTSRAAESADTTAP